MFESTRIAEVNRLMQTSSKYDGRFKDRLQLDQTGSLIITSTRTTDSGLYQLTIVSRETSFMNYNVTVYDCIHCCGFTEAVIRLALSALVAVAAVAVLLYDIRASIHKTFYLSTKNSPK
ncbi:hypothetical protein cypCar_00021464 [Cyprinus carpio]|nr:hypothetical protein cypCar_00021464 [Cyprinus carpio]